MDKYPDSVLEQIKQSLLMEKGKLSVRLNKLSEEDPFINPERTNDNAASDTDAKEEVDHERIEVLKQDMLAGIGALDAALERISKGSYGFCANCRLMIDTDRLAIHPAARYCVKCEQKLAVKKS